MKVYTRQYFQCINCVQSKSEEYFPSTQHIDCVEQISVHNYISTLLHLLFWAISFFFFISNKDIYSRTLPYAEKHKAKRKLQKEKIKKEKRKKKILITKERAKEYRKRVSRGESSSLRPVKQGATERSQ